MAKTKITRTMVLQQIVKNLNENKVYVTRLGKKIIPKSENDLPPRMKKSSNLGVNNPEYNKAHGQLYYELITKPNKIKKVAPTPLTPKKLFLNKIEKIAESSIDNPMKGYKDVARTGRVESKKLIINMSSTMTCTILNSGLITVDFK